MKKIIYDILIGLILILVSCSKNEEVDPSPTVPTVNISVSDLVFSDIGAEPSFFTITSDVPWVINFSDTKNVPTWCKVEPMSGNAGTTNVVVSIIQDNDSYDDRSTNMKIMAGQTVKIITIVQKKKNAIILSKNKFEVGPDESTIQIDLKTNIEYAIDIPEEFASWIIKGSAPKTKGLQDKSEIFTIREGTVDGARKGLIIFKSGELKDTVSVFQAQKNALILTQKEYNLSNETTSIEVELRSNVEYEVVIPKEAVWVKKSQTRAMRTDVLSFSVDKNETYDDRTAKIAVKDKNSSLSDTLIIHQSQLNVIFIGSNKIELGYNDQDFSVKVKSNIAFTFNIPQEAQEWIKVSQTRGLVESSVNFTVNVNNEFDREVVIPCTGNNNTSDTLYVKQEGVKTILMEFYNATGGSNWNNNTNWGSNKPINEWYGISVFDKTINGIELYNNNLNGILPLSVCRLVTLQELRLSYNENLRGSIPEEIGLLSNLRGLKLMYNNLSGNIPKSIGNLTEMFSIALSCNNLTGVIPDDIGNLSKLYILELYGNKLTGTIPPQLGHYCHSMSLNWNYLSGPIPNSILTKDNWTGIRDYIIYQNGYTIYPPLEYSVLENHESKDLNLQPVNSHNVFAENRYTILYNYSYECPFSIVYTPTVVDLFKKYRNKGLGVISYHACILSEGKLSNIKNYVAQQKMDEFVNLLHLGEYIDNYGSTEWDASYFFGGRGTPEVLVVDNQGRLCWGLAEDRDKLPEHIRSLLGEPEPEKPYESTDFSKDGEVVSLQKATVGNGVNLVILGDGFVDKDMNTGGKYEAKAREAMEHFFAKEPVKTFRNRFNVYCVKAVSLNEGIGKDSQTAFLTEYGEGTSISGDNGKCFEYTLKVPSIKDISNTTIITIINDSKYAGTCWMYSDNNASIAYCPLVAYDSEQFAQIIQHEAMGHGFGKLADEYAYMGRIPQTEIDGYNQMYNYDGWWSNIDFTNNPQKIKWSHFLDHSLYSNLVGIYEGGATYEYGVYRPTENSIMRYNVGEFNAPSRQAIYKRIMNLSGEGYSYDKFLEYDHINRVSTRSVYAVPKDFIPLSPPIVVKR
jgi:Leucine Rich Repeat./IgA Peptidase M64.